MYYLSYCTRNKKKCQELGLDKVNLVSRIGRLGEGQNIWGKKIIYLIGIST